MKSLMRIMMQKKKKKTQKKIKSLMKMELQVGQNDVFKFLEEVILLCSF